jgi:hypothetical protein
MEEPPRTFARLLIEMGFIICMLLALFAWLGVQEPRW